MRFMGLIVLIPTSVLLTASFFVLFAIEKVAGQGLKTFGRVVAALLIIVAVLLLSVGVYTVSTGRHLMMQQMCPMMGGMKGDMKEGKGKYGTRRGEMKGMMRGPMQQGGMEEMPGGAMKK